MKIITFFAFLLLFMCSVTVFGQPKIRCSTAEQMQKVFQKDAAARTRYETLSRQMNEKINRISQSNQLFRQDRTDQVFTIPVVVHILLGDPTLVTDELVQRQLDTLNYYYGAQPAGDSLRVYEPFRALYGRSQIRFCLAKRDPAGLPVTGITRKATSLKFNDTNSDNITNGAAGGVTAWDTRHYLNMWIVQFNDNSTLGYSYLPGTFQPGDGRAGFVADYRAFGSGASYLYTGYNAGKTAVHEIGHFFNLMHPWGDEPSDNCIETDFVEDTPPTSGPTYGCPLSPVLDACSKDLPGKMAQNHMDYMNDACMVLFTKQQVMRMHTALSEAPDRKTLLSSNGCSPVQLVARDIKPVTFIEPNTSVCETSQVPVIQVLNTGADTIKSFTANYSINGGPIKTANFAGSFGLLQTINLPLGVNNFVVGNNTIKLFTTNPNGLNDLNTGNDTITFTFRVLTPIQNSFVEGFERVVFPPADWEISQIPPDHITWRRTTRAGKNSLASAYMNNYNYAAFGTIDNLITPPVSFTGVDSVYIKFDIAAATYSFPGSTGVPLDTVEVLASTDCGRTFTPIYKKYGYELQTIGDPNNVYLDEFWPNNTQWRTDSINLTSLVGSSNTVRFAFRNTNNYENNIFIDNVNFYTKVLPARLKQSGILISPNPFRDRFSIQHYLPPVNLRSVVVYNAVGQQVYARNFGNGAAQSFMEVDLSNQSAGVYTIRMIYTDRSASHRVVKVQ